MVSDTKAVKSVGEFWTCCKLAMNGWAPALTRDGLERTDILAERSHAPFDVTQISVQVKTSRNERWALTLPRSALNVACMNGSSWSDGMKTSRPCPAILFLGIMYLLEHGWDI